MRIYLSLFFILLNLSTPVFGESVAEIAMYEGADRDQRIIAGAQKEGSLLIYTSIAEKDLMAITSDFEKRYGVKAVVWRASTNKVLQRAVLEAKANRFDFDVVHISAPEMEALHREKLLQEAKSPHFKDLIPGAIPPHREWASQFLSVFVHAYNTNKIKKEELPRTYQDLLDPKWKGRLGIEAKDQEWFFTVVKEMGEEKGLKFFRDLAATNGLSVRSGHTLLNNMVVSGEVPLALTLYSYMPEQAKKKGAPIDWFALDPVVGRANGMGISKKAPHPHAAMLFYDYMLSEAQPLMVKMDYVPTNKKADSPVKNMKIKFVDPVVALDEYEKWEKLYEDLALKGR
jgi:iron(III) transport system substrate-binding protein